MAEDKTLTVESSMVDFKSAHQAKQKLIEREHDDFLFALGEQWTKDDIAALRKNNITPATDNRIAPNLFLLTGLERQNRTEFRAFPEGEEDGVKANIASALLKNVAKKSGLKHKASEQFKDGITAGESHLELFLNYDESIINGSPRWKKCDGNTLFPDPRWREYDFSDARFIYKLTVGVERGDLINMYPEKEDMIMNASSGKLDLSKDLAGTKFHLQLRDYPKESAQANATDGKNAQDDGTFDLIERYYKKWVKHFFIGDRKTGKMTEVKSKKAAEDFIREYQEGIDSDRTTFEEALTTFNESETGVDESGEELQAPPSPPVQDPERYFVVPRQVPEIWIFAHVPGMAEPLADEVAWFYPKWKQYPFVPYFARFSTAPLIGDERHLLVQGLVYGVKDAQMKHNKAEMLLLRHLNTSANSGWLAEEDVWVDPDKVAAFGTSAGINLEYKKGRPKPEKILPAPLSQAHAVVSSESAESIKAQLGINADLLASQQGGGDSGRAIALRQRQGLLMVQELFDNASRSKEIGASLLVSQLGEIFDTETAMKVLGEAFLVENFPAPELIDEEESQPGQPPVMKPIDDPETGRPMTFDRELAEATIAEVLNGDLEKYDISVGEAVASDSQRLANAAEVKEIAQTFPGLVSPKIIIKHSQLPESVKTEMLADIQAQQAAAAAAEAKGGEKPPVGPDAEAQVPPQGEGAA